MRSRFTLALVLASAYCGVAHADRVVLTSGAVLEGAAAEQADKVVVTLESGAISLPRASVARIERERPPLDVVAEQRAHLREGDVSGRLNLARFCRQHGLANTERELLLEVLALAPDQPEAHARLGHVRTKDGYVDGSELEKQRRAQRESDNRAAREERARGDLAAEKARLERDRAELALREERMRSDAYAARSVAAPQTSVFIPYAFAPRTSQPWATPQHTPAPSFDINGVRSPHDMSFSLPGVRDPRSYFGP